MSVLAPSSVLLLVTEGDSRLLPGLEVAELFYEGESAEAENEGGFLYEELIENSPRTPDGPGWWITDNFRVSYYKDYWGEVDVDLDVQPFRRATSEDIGRFFE